MQKHRRLLIVAGLVLNVMGVFCTTWLVVKYFLDWESLSVKPDAKHANDLLHVVFSEGLPLCAATMAISAILIFVLRKGPQDKPAGI